ncbi:MAG: DUF4255 domain-containing protein [bacterium]|nr:DUF4255 domain-containing protein [bacterium]
MADFDVIADVSRTLRDVLTGGLSTLNPPPPPVAEIHDLQGAITTSPARLTVFLYEVVEDESLRNRPLVRQNAPPAIQISKPPMALQLKYLMTPWSGDRLTDHQILGRTMQILYDQSILSGPQLAAGLAGTDVALKLKMSPKTLEDRTRIFNSVQKPYHLSVSYEVRVVNLDPTRSRSVQPVASRTLVPAVPEATP